MQDRELAHALRQAVFCRIAPFSRALTKALLGSRLAYGLDTALPLRVPAGLSAAAHPSHRQCPKRGRRSCLAGPSSTASKNAKSCLLQRTLLLGSGQGVVCAPVWQDALVPHCFFRQEFTGSLLQRILRGGTDQGVGMTLSGRRPWRSIAPPSSRLGLWLQGVHGYVPLPHALIKAL